MTTIQMMMITIPMMNINSILKDKGLYTDTIRVIDDYLHGETKIWKAQYGRVIEQLHLYTSNDVTANIYYNKTEYGYALNIRKINQELHKNIKNKLDSIFRNTTCNVKTGQTHSIHERLKKNKIIGHARVIFDNIVRKLNKAHTIISFHERVMISNVYYHIYPYGNKEFRINEIMHRHLQDYNYTEYFKLWSNNYIDKWAYKINWGSIAIQESKRDVCNNIKQLYIDTIQYQKNKNKETTNEFLPKFQLGENIIIYDVNNTYINIRYRISKTEEYLMNPRIRPFSNLDSERLYILDPFKKGKRIYADTKKAIHTLSDTKQKLCKPFIYEPFPSPSPSPEQNVNTNNFAF